MKKFFREFKEFALRGNVMDLAVAVIIGAAFQAIVTSLSQDILSPLIGLFAKTDLSGQYWNIFGVKVMYGSFLTAIINFVIMALVIFLLVKGLNKLAGLGKKKEEPKSEEPTLKICPFCCTEISVHATRCPHCTSVLTEEKSEEA